jgi:hypothetical protein
LIKLGVDTHGGQYTFARMIDHQGFQPPQKLAPDAFITFLEKQLTLARRVVMVYEAGPYGFALYRQRASWASSAWSAPPSGCRADVSE